MNLKLLQQTFANALSALGSRCGSEIASRFTALKGTGGASMVGMADGTTLEQKLATIGQGGGEGGGGLPAGPLATTRVFDTGDLLLKDLTLGAFTRFEGAGFVQVLILDEEDAQNPYSYPANAELHFRNLTGGPMTIVNNGGDSVLVGPQGPSGQIVIPSYGTGMLKRVAKDLYDYVGSTM